MANLRYEYSKTSNNQVYSDGSIERQMLEMAQAGNVDWYRDGRWPVVYHFAPMRQNILNWYPFRDGAAILEVGAGCGAITGMLCRRGKKVDAIELTEIRSKINHARNRDCDNLNIFICDINDFSTEEKYDYVVVNGVLEYAAFMMKGEDPYTGFLQRVRSFLKPEGILLLAIENRIGLKYFAGSREDHLGEYFVGVNGYRQQDRIRTFSRRELGELLSRSGFEVLRDFYPFPDYKFPMEILTRESINARRLSDGSRDYHMDGEWVDLFSAETVMATLQKEGVAASFANSFLLEIALSGAGVQGDRVSYVKVSSNRREDKRICTLIDEQAGTVRKAWLTPEGEAHVRDMLRWQGDHGAFRNIPCRAAEGGIEFDLLRGTSLLETLTELDRSGEEVQLSERVKAVFDLMRSAEPDCEPQERDRFEEVFGKASENSGFHWKRNLNIDCIPENLFPRQDGGYDVIDYEWCFDFPVPVEYVFWRFVLQLERACGKPLPGIREAAGISREMSMEFDRWERHFMTSHVGTKNMNHLTVPKAGPGAIALRGGKGPLSLAWRLLSPLSRRMKKIGALAGKAATRLPRRS